jgi:hypothetical protein
MSIEIECPVFVSDGGRRFHVYAYPCEEFPTQLDFIRVTFGGAEVFNGPPKSASTDFEKQVVAHAQDSIKNLVWENDSVIDEND